MPDKSIFIIAGEKSGDRHAANLIKELIRINPKLSIHGLGGNLMQEAGCKLLYNMLDISVVGFVEVLRHIKEYKKIFYETLDYIVNLKPEKVVLIDYPGFNLRIANKLKKLCPDIKIIYYISPQIWAWHKSRIKQIKKNIDKMIVIFPFEVDFYKKNNFDNVVFCGHPLLDIKEFQETEEIRRTSKLIGLFPGSRKSEINYNLPLMLDIVRDLNDNYLFKLAVANEHCKSAILAILEKYPKVYVELEYDGYQLMKKAEFIITASGTATVEIACMSTPMVILYKISFWTWLLAKLLVKIEHIGMVNILAGKRIVPEYIQYDIVSKKIAEYIDNKIKNKREYSDIVEELKKVRQKLGNSGASKRAAKEVLCIQE